MTQLTAKELKQAPRLLPEYYDIISAGNNKIDKTTVHSYDINLWPISPLAIPLSCEPFQHRKTARLTIDRYLKPELLKMIDSSQQATKVLLKRRTHLEVLLSLTCIISEKTIRNVYMFLLISILANINFCAQSKLWKFQHFQPNTDFPNTLGLPCLPESRVCWVVFNRL